MPSEQSRSLAAINAADSPIFADKDVKLPSAIP